MLPCLKNRRIIIKMKYRKGGAYGNEKTFTGGTLIYRRKRDA